MQSYCLHPFRLVTLTLEWLLELPAGKAMSAMKRELHGQPHADFEAIVPTGRDSGTEFWLARDLQGVPGHLRAEKLRRHSHEDSSR